MGAPPAPPARPVRLVSIAPSRSAGKKWDALFAYADGRRRTVAFGAEGYSDFTLHRDPARRDRYLARHAAAEDWSRPDTPGALSRWILWNLPGLRASVADFRRRFGL
jgi:hypothetical protein